MGYKYYNLIDAINGLNEYWGEQGQKVIEACLNNPIIMSTESFLNNYCTACGGNWGGMLLSGIQRLRPDVYDLIPDNMGDNGNIVFICLCNVLYLLRIGDDE